MILNLENKQLYSFTRNQTQVFVSGVLGDGHIAHTNSNSFVYLTNCKHLEYLKLKKQLLNDRGRIKLLNNNGYSKTPIWVYYGGAYKDLEYIKNFSLQSLLDNIDSLGLALWFYDDGSLHKRDLYYNLNTQNFDLNAHENILVPFFLNFGLNPKIRIDNRRSKKYYYLGFNKYEGAFEINKLLQTLPVECYSYKLWSSEAIQKWSKLQEQLKSTDKVLTNRQLAHLWKTL